MGWGGVYCFLLLPVGGKLPVCVLGVWWFENSRAVLYYFMLICFVSCGLRLKAAPFCGVWFLVALIASRMPSFLLVEVWVFAL